MCCHTTVTKAVVTAACALAIALSAIGMGVNSTWAGSDQASGLKFTPVSSDVVVQPVPAAGPRHQSNTMPSLSEVTPVAAVVKASSVPPRLIVCDACGRKVCKDSSECASGCTCVGINEKECAVTSDQRLKRDIVLLKRLDSGIGLYRFRYLWSDQVYVGVVAQEVANKFPDAVARGSDGYLRVFYDRLGLKMMTWDEWQRSSLWHASMLTPEVGETPYP